MPILTGYCIALWKMIWLWQIFLITMSLCHLPPECSPQLPVLLAEYTFRTKRDVTDYLALLDQIDDYFASLLLYEQEKAAAGFFMPACSSEKVRKQCDTIVTTEELAQGTHF